MRTTSTLPTPVQPEGNDDAVPQDYPGILVTAAHPVPGHPSPLLHEAEPAAVWCAVTHMLKHHATGKIAIAA